MDTTHTTTCTACADPIMGTPTCATCTDLLGERMTVADLRRRLRIGATLTMTAHDWYPAGRLIGVPRTIVMVNTVGIGLATGRPDGSATVSRMDWPRAEHLRATGADTFAVGLDGDAGTTPTAWMHYRIATVPA